MKKIPPHPFLLSAYAVMALYANNAAEIRPVVMIRPMILCLGLAMGLLVLIKFFTRDWEAAALVSSFLLLCFYSYGHVYEFLRNNLLMGINFGRHSILGTLYIIILIVGLYFLFRKRGFSRDFTFIFNVVTFVLLIFPVFTILRYELRSTRLEGSNPAVENAVLKWQESILAQSGQDLSKNEEEISPDIYVIILDMYGRQDALLEDLGFDNSNFLEKINGLGFVTAECSRSNYAQTRLSLASFLNMDYLPDVNQNVPIDDVLERAIKHSLVRKQLSAAGYEMIAFENGFDFSEIQDADQYYQIAPGSFFDTKFQPFEAMLVKTTLLRLPIDLHPQSLSTLLSTITFPYSEHIKRVQHTLEVLKTLPGQQGQKFIYAHLMIPHPPYIFEPDGSIRMDDRYYREALNQPVSEEYYQAGYKDNLAYTNAAILPLLEKIIADSETPPVIILLSDHGMREQNRMENLIAVYNQGGGLSEINPSITPVNIFRLILNEHFGTNYPLLADRSYYSEYPDRYLLTEVEENSPACRP